MKDVQIVRCGSILFFFLNRKMRHPGVCHKIARICGTTGTTLKVVSYSDKDFAVVLESQAQPAFQAVIRNVCRELCSQGLTSSVTPPKTHDGDPRLMLPKMDGALLASFDMFDEISQGDADLRQTARGR